MRPAAPSAPRGDRSAGHGAKQTHANSRGVRAAWRRAHVGARRVPQQGQAGHGPEAARGPRNKFLPAEGADGHGRDGAWQREDVPTRRTA